MLAVLPPAGNSVVRVTRNTVRSATTAYPYLDTKTLILHSSTDTALRWGEFLNFNIDTEWNCNRFIVLVVSIDYDNCG